MAVVKSGTDFRELTTIHLTLTAVAPDAEPGADAAAGSDADAAGDAAAGAAEPSLLWSAAQQAAQLPAAVADAMADLAARAHCLCSQWAHLAGIPALAGCTLQPAPDASCAWGTADEDGLEVGEPPMSPSGGGAGACAAGRSAAAVYEASAAASLATSLCCCRWAGGSRSPAGGGGKPPLHLAVQCVRHAITSDLPEDPEVAEMVEVRAFWVVGCVILCFGASVGGLCRPTSGPAAWVQG